MYKPKLIKTPKDLLNNVNNTLSHIKKSMPRKRIYKFKPILKGFMNKLRGDKKLSKELDDHLNKKNVNTSGDFNYYRLTKNRSAFNDRYLLYTSNGDNNSSINQYFDKIRPGLLDLIDYQKTQGEWKVQLSMKVTFVSFIDNDRKQIMHTKGHNETIM